MVSPSLGFGGDDCERLFQAPKFVASRIRWKQRDDDTCLFQAKVLTSDGIGLDLFGYWHQDQKYHRVRWGFSLRYRGFIVRSWDMASKHRNPAHGGKIKGPHKHRFSSSRIPRLAYSPNPPLSLANPNDTLMDFLKEANISLPTDYTDFMFPAQYALQLDQ